MYAVAFFAVASLVLDLWSEPTVAQPLSGIWTKPFSITAVCACMRMVLLPAGW